MAQVGQRGFDHVETFRFHVDLLWLRKKEKL